MFITRAVNEKRSPAYMSALALIFLTPMTAGAIQGDCAPVKGEPVQVGSVDIHLELRLHDGRKLRLNGIEAPRGTPGNPGLPETARLWLESALARDPARASISPGDRDRWGRNAARIGSGASPDLAVELLRAGWARVDAADAPTTCLSLLFDAEREARAAGRGLWADPAYAVLDAASPERFQGHGGRIVITEGVVTSVAKWRTLTFLNFGKARRGEVSAALSRSLAAAMEKAGSPPASLKGAHIRIRGLLNVRNSPRIEIFSQNAIEILAPGDKPFKSGYEK